MSKRAANKLLLNLYGGLWRLAIPVLKRNRRLREGLEQRFAPDSWPGRFGSASELLAYGQGEALRVWIQAASGGEAGLAHALAPALAAGFAAEPAFAGRPLHLLCTTCTRQGMDVLEKLAPAPRSALSPDCGGRGPRVAFFPRYFPFDRPSLMEKALKQADPHLIVLLETELWPGLLSAAAAAGVPVLVLNARMTEKSFSAYKLLRSWLRPLAPQAVLAVSEADAERFAALFSIPGSVATMSNMKFDRLQEAAPRQADVLRLETGFEEDSLLLVLASVREEEEDLLLPILRDMGRLDFEGGRLALAVAPRHMHRIKAWQGKLSAAGIPWRLRSRCKTTAGDRCREAQPGPLPLMLWDSFGDLLSLYAMADAAFVGGSLAPLGGQNFLEPASLGLRPVVGPHISNFLWAGEEFFKQGLGLQASHEELPGVLVAQLEERRKALREAKSPEERCKIRAAMAESGRERFRAWLSPRLGGSARAAGAIVAALRQRQPLP